MQGTLYTGKRTLNSSVAGGPDVMGILVSHAHLPRFVESYESIKDLQATTLHALKQMRS